MSTEKLSPFSRWMLMYAFSCIPSLFASTILLHDFLCAKKRSVRDNDKPREDRFLFHYAIFWWNGWKLDGDAFMSGCQSNRQAFCEHLIQIPKICIMLTEALLLTSYSHCYTCKFSTLAFSKSCRKFVEISQPY